MATDSPEDAERRQAIERELRRLEESAEYSAQSQFEQTKQWHGVNLLLGLPTEADLAAAVERSTIEA
jgi:hypothetical protein